MRPKTRASTRLGYLYSRYPVLSQTFCDMEMLELERRGWELILGSLYPPKTELRHGYLKQLRASIRYAPDSRSLDKLARTAKRGGTWPAALIAEHEQKFGPDYKAALRARNALFFVRLFEAERVEHFHVHFANRAAHTAIFVKAISGLPFSITAHGQDFMSDLGNEELLRELCAAAEFVAAETDYSRNLLATRCPESAAKIVRVYNGLDLSRFPELEQNDRRGNAIQLLSVGRLVRFKGFTRLVEACSELAKRGVDFQCRIIGEGELEEELERSIRRHDLGGRIHLAGARSEEEVLPALRACDVFVFAAETDERGASDIFPTVIAEAMASSKPVVSTTVAGIPELVADEHTGLLVQPRDPIALANAIERLTADEDLRLKFGRAGRQRVQDHFTIDKTIEPLLEQLRSAMR